LLVGGISSLSPTVCVQDGNEEPWSIQVLSALPKLHQMGSLDNSADSLSSCLEKAEGDLRSLSRQFEEEFHHRFSDSQVQIVSFHLMLRDDLSEPTSQRITLRYQQIILLASHSNLS
jgi:hypothetical protein